METVANDLIEKKINLTNVLSSSKKKIAPTENRLIPLRKIKNFKLIYQRARYKISQALYLYYRKRQLALKKSLKTQKTQLGIQVDVTTYKQYVCDGLPKQIKESLDLKLNKWEEESGFLYQNVTLDRLAKSLGTNKNYLSKYINSQKGENFTTYVNNLRLEFIMKNLQIKSIYTKYTVKAIAEEIGFRTGESFSKTFHKKYGLYPSQYLKELSTARTKSA